MKVTGIIAEYHPFHNGHKYHLEQAKKLTDADAVVAVISGSMTQRGGAAICDKWSRAQMAVDNGVDLVLELPYAFAVNSAEEFARGGISILKGLGCVTDLVFGCESQPEQVISMARSSAEQEEEFQKAVRSGLEEGLSYPQARGKAMMQFKGEDASKEGSKTDSLDQPNDILAVEYVRQMVLQNFGATPHGVTRLGAYHDPDVNEEAVFSSATAVRKAIREDRWEDVERAVPEATMEILYRCKNEQGVDGSMDLMILSRILTLGPEGLRKVLGCAEGLEYRIWNALPMVTTVEGLLEEASSGRYPKARLRRMLLHGLVGLTLDIYEPIRQSADQGQLYARVLGCSEVGAKLLKKIKKTEGAIPVLTNLNRELTDEQKKVIRGEVSLEGQNYDGALLALKMDIRAADLCQMSRGKALYDGSDFVKGPYIAHKNEKNHK